MLKELRKLRERPRGVSTVTLALGKKAQLEEEVVGPVRKQFCVSEMCSWRLNSLKWFTISVGSVQDKSRWNDRYGSAEVWQIPTEQDR